MRRHLPVVVIVLSILAAVPGNSVGNSAGNSHPESPSDSPNHLVTVPEYGEALHHAYQYRHHGGDFRTFGGAPHGRARLKRWREHARGPVSREVMRERTRARVGRWRFHRRIDRLTPFGAYAIPEYIVMAESRGDRCAANSASTAGGYYQFLDSTWAAYGGTPYPRYHPAACAPAAEQHQVAARAWDGGAGSSHWALTR